jgi:hypothetical protein
VPNPLRSFADALLSPPGPDVVKVRGAPVEFRRMPSIEAGAPEALSKAGVNSFLRDAADAENRNLDLFERLEDAFPEDPDLPPDSDIVANSGIDWMDDHLASGEVVGRTSPARIDAAAYGEANAPEIRRELARRAKGGMMFDQSLPQNYPDARIPLHHYDREIPIVKDGSRYAPKPLGDHPAAYFPNDQVIVAKYDDLDPGKLRHENGHVATEGAGRTEAQEAKTNWLSEGSGEKFHPFQLDDHHAEYLTSFTEMKPYVRDFKYQVYNGLADGTVDPIMKRPFFASLTDQLDAEAADFGKIMDETEIGTTSIEDVANMRLPALREWIAEVYQKMTPEHQARMRLLYAMLSGMPIAMVDEELEEDFNGSN